MEELKKLVRSKATGTNKNGVIHIDYEENDVFEIAKQAYNMALDDVANKTMVGTINGHIEYYEVIDKGSILKLKKK